jgi:hypothetical protein
MFPEQAYVNAGDIVRDADFAIYQARRLMQATCY